LALLTRGVATGEKTVPFAEDGGYLHGLLTALEIPLASQALVFSKTSVQNQRIGPDSPRAIYFSDEAAVGYIPGSPTLEVLAQDPVKGSLFYVVPQSPDGFRPRREGQCLTCHIGTRTRGVAGWQVQSVETDARGRPVSGVSPFREATPWAERCGGWYVSGRAEGFVHRGNLRSTEDFAHHRDEPAFRSTLNELSPLVDLTKYPSPHSDVVAQLVLQHQSQGYNLLTRVGQAARLGQAVEELDELVRCLLLIDLPPLPCPVSGSSDFATIYSTRGSRDELGRSLRELDLATRVFRWHASPLVLTRTFRQLPPDVRRTIGERMMLLLNGREEWPGTAPSLAERTATLEILRATVSDWPR
jgi:hypothetical protein